MERKVSQSRFEAKAGAEGKGSGIVMKYDVIDSYNDRGIFGMFTRTIRENGGKVRFNKQHINDPLGIIKLRDTATALLGDYELNMNIAAARDLHEQIKSGLVNGLSIGYETKSYRYDKQGVRELLDVDLLEVSAVTWQAVPGAVIDPASVKAFGNDAEAVVRYLGSLVASAKSQATLQTISNELTRLIAREQIDAVRDGMIRVASRISHLESQLKGF
jgi:uncharacterized protein